MIYLIFKNTEKTTFTDKTFSAIKNGDNGDSDTKTAIRIGDKCDSDEKSAINNADIKNIIPEYMQNHNEVTTKEIAGISEKKESRTRDYLKKLKDEEKIIFMGKNKGRRYKLNK